MNRTIRYAAAALLAVTLSSVASAARAQQAAPWTARSDEHAQVVLEVMARFSPEGAGRLGIEGLDEEIFDLREGFVDRQMTAAREVKAELELRLAAETEPKVRQDLEILIESVDDQIRGTELFMERQIPYFDLHQTVFQGLRALLDDRVAPERRAAALVRLRKYAGLEEGYDPIVELAIAFVRERMDVPGLIAPYGGEIEKNLANAPRFVEGIPALFEKYGIEGYEEPMAALEAQLGEWEAFVRGEILPRARDDFRLPPELYAFQLEQVGVDIPVEELVSRAKVAFREIQNEMQALAPLVAAEKGIDAADYRDVILALKKDQLVGEAILPFYERRIEELEAIIEREGVVSLPDRPMRIRLASEAESAAVPAPNMSPPRLIGNTGEMGEFVLPLRIPGEGGETVGFDDFTYDAAGWTLTVHEGRPGHELQFSSVIENGVSVARAIFAFNSVNVEGWALYAEAEMRPYLPLDGQLISLQHRLMRAARAFLDPGLQRGEITQEEAMRVLREDVVLSEAMAMQEVERYTFWSPGQATSYFYGYLRLMELRTDVERALGERFDRKAYHDFVLAQGLLPPALLRKAVMEEFVPAQTIAAN